MSGRHRPAPIPPPPPPPPRPSRAGALCLALAALAFGGGLVVYSDDSGGRLVQPGATTPRQTAAPCPDTTWVGDGGRVWHQCTPTP